MSECPECKRISLEYDPARKRVWCLYAADCGFHTEIGSVPSRDAFHEQYGHGGRKVGPPAMTAADLERALRDQLERCFNRGLCEHPDDEGRDCGVQHCIEAVMARARRWGAAKALEEVKQLGRDAFMCHSLMTMPSLVEERPKHVHQCPGCAVAALSERLAREVEGA